MKSLRSYIAEYCGVPDNIKAFTIIKPGFLEYKGEIYKHINSKGFKLSNFICPVRMSLEQAQELYKMHKEKEWYDSLCKYMSSDNVEIAMWTYDNDDDPIAAMDTIKKHFREKYGKSDMENCMHSSDSLENVKREAGLFF